ncbi:hypothetical protein ColTof4_04057 [Colletotrichum tofieldiae]|nr:hypothetical protein ColTof3_13905 [Colletotrichum tofieldiae]GKT71634.1 hypothetical protein ColTof4_04057 [Colletotrichum tofieldiae]
MALAEMRDAVSFAISEVDDFGTEDLIDTDEIFKRCSSLVRKAYTTKGEPNIELAHFTVEQYILDGIDSGSDVGFFSYDCSTAKQELSRACLGFFISTPVCVDIDTSFDDTLVLDHVIERFIKQRFYLRAVTQICGRLAPEIYGSLEFWKHAEENPVFEKFRSIFGPQKGMTFVELVIGSFFEERELDRPTLG